MMEDGLTTKPLKVPSMLKSITTSFAGEFSTVILMGGDAWLTGNSTRLSSGLLTSNE